MDAANLHSLLESLQTTDNAVRSQAETYYTSQIRDNRETFLAALVSSLNSVDAFSVSNRKFATVLLRRILLSGEGMNLTGDSLVNSFQLMKPESQNHIKAGLLAAVDLEVNFSFYSNICELIGSICCNFLEPSEWPQVQQYMQYTLQHADAKKRIIGFSLLGMLSESICSSPSFSGSIASICSIINSGLQVTQDPDCIDLIKISMVTLNEILAALEKESEVLSFKDLIPSIIFTFKALVLQVKESRVHDIVVKFVECWIDIAEGRALFFEDNLGYVFNEIMAIIEQNLISPAIRRMLIEFLTTLCINRHKSVRKLKGPNGEKYYFAHRLFPVCVHLMLNLPDDPQWEKYDNENDVNDESEGTLDYEHGEDALCRMTEQLGVRSTFSIVSSHLIELFKSSDWKCVHAALRYLGGYMCVSATIERPEDKTQHQDELIGTIVLQIQREHPRVRHAALYALNQFIYHHGDSLENPRHFDTILGILLENTSCSSNKSPLVRMQAIGCLENFLGICPQVFIEKHVSRILTEMHTALSEGPFSVQEHCVDVITSLADSLKNEQMAGYYDALMPILKSIMEYAKVNSQEALWGRTLECCAMLGEASGKTKFLADATEMMNSLVQIQSQISEENDLRKFLMKAWVRIARCLGTEFLPFLQVVMENLLNAINQDVSKGTGDIDLEDIDADDLGSDIEIVERDGFLMATRTSAVEEQLDACRLMHLIIERLQESFCPYVEITAKSMLTLLHKSPHDDVRSQCIAIIPEMIRSSAKATLPDRTALKAFADYAIGQLIESIKNEESNEVICIGLEALRESLLFACVDWASLNAQTPRGNFAGKPPTPNFDARFMLLNEVQMTAIVQMTKELLTLSIQQRAILRAEAKLASRGRDEKDDDDDDDEQLLMKQGRELFFKIAFLLEMLFRTHGAAFLPVYLKEYNDIITGMSQSHCLKEDQQFAFAVINDVIAHGIDNSVATQFFQQSMPAILEAVSKNPDAEVRCNAALAIKHASVKFPALFSQYATAALSCLAESVFLGSGDGQAKGYATDAAVESIAFILESMERAGIAMDYEKAWGMVMDYLPFRHDVEEGHNVINLLARLITSRHPRFSSEQRLLQAIVVFLQIVKSPLSNADIDSLILSTIHGILENNWVSRASAIQFIARYDKGIQDAFTYVISASGTPHSSSPGASAPIHDVLFRLS